jgi:hypothetical protein
MRGVGDRGRKDGVARAGVDAGEGMGPWVVIQSSCHGLVARLPR